MTAVLVQAVLARSPAPPVAVPVVLAAVARLATVPDISALAVAACRSSTLQAPPRSLLEAAVEPVLVTQPTPVPVAKPALPVSLLVSRFPVMTAETQSNELVLVAAVPQAVAVAKVAVRPDLGRVALPLWLAMATLAIRVSATTAVMAPTSRT